MTKKLTFCVTDTETATMPFVNEMQLTAEQKKKIAIAKPLVYDLGWTICHRDGEIVKKCNYLIAEIFSVPSVFNTAYYKEKRPIYIEKLNKGEISILPWRDVMKLYLADLAECDGVGAFNSMFDFKKAIPFTELYINKLYSTNYNEWEDIQLNHARAILDGTIKENEKDFDAEYFSFRGVKYPLFDLWGLSTEHLLNNATYKKECLEHNLLTNSGTFFKTSAESTYQYLCDKYDFIESHTALDDAIIETYILSKIAKRHAIDMGIKFFPFRDLGYTYDFCMRRKIPNIDECQKVLWAMGSYVDNKIDEAENSGCPISNYVVGLINRIETLEKYVGINQ